MTAWPGGSGALTVAVGGLLMAAVALSACSTTGSGSGASASLSSPSAPAGSRGSPASGSPSSPTDPALPADLSPVLRASCRPDLSPGWLTRENARRGITVAVPPTDTVANLYLDTMSATCGQVVHAAVSAPAGTYRLRVVRVGWYRGVGARVVATSASFRAGRQADAARTARAGTPGWRTSAAMTVARTWLPGMYLVQLLSGSTAVQAAPLVVLAPPGARRAPLLFVIPAMTWTAYTGYGGRSLYRNWNLQGRRATGDRARTADIARPIEGPGVYAVHRYTTPLLRAVGQIVPAGAASEVDAAVPGVSPAGVAVLAAGGAFRQGRQIDATVTYYTAGSGAGVFDAGSVFAGCSTDDSCRATSVPAVTRQFWSGTIVRVVRAFAEPRFGATHPAPAQRTVPTYAQLLERYGSAVAGTTIADGD